MLWNRHRSTVIAAMVAAAGVVGMPGLARAEDAGGAGNASLDAKVKALQDRLDAQEAELQQFRAQQGDNWLNARRAEEVKALVREVLTDADTRASLADQPITAGYDGKRFFLASEDGLFRLNIYGQIQLRYVADFRDHPAGPPASPTSPNDSVETGFEIRRARLYFDGTIGTPKFEYLLQMTANRDTGAIELEKAQVAYSLFPWLKIGGGRFKDNFLHEETISDSRQQAVERSLVNQVFTQNYVEGAFADAAPVSWAHLWFAVTDGQRSGDPGGTATGFLNGGNDFNNDATNVAFTGRADFKLAGEWKQADEFAAWSKDPFAAFIGVAAHYEVGETGDKQASATTGTGPGFAGNVGPYDDFITYTVDAQVKWNGFNVYGALIGQHFDNTTATPVNPHGDSLNNFGALIQAGYFVLPDKLEPFARYEWLRVDPAVATSDINAITAGVNYYLNKHNLKFTLDAVWYLEPVTSANTGGASGSTGTGLTGIGALADAPGHDNQVTLRAQFQLLF